MAKIKVLVVDDAVMMRRMISGVLESDSEIEVAGLAATGSIALQKIPQAKPDVITMDVEMPGLNGIETVREIRKSYPKLPIIMFSSITRRGAVATLDAISAGATDYVTKPTNVESISEGMERLRSDLVPKIKAYARPPERSRGAASGPRNGRPARARARKAPSAAPDIVCIGVSTGGPNALADLFKGIPPTFPKPVVIVQHMPPLFTALLAERLNQLNSLVFHEGSHGQPIQKGHAYIAPGGKHMTLRRSENQVVIQLNEDPPENSCRPAVDVLFRSVPSVYGGSVLSVIMTGMGSDGLIGCEAISQAGGQIIVQDEPSSVVWGMPGYVAEAGLADQILPLQQLAQGITRRAGEARPLAAALH